MAHVLALDIWMNGVAVGRWERPPNAPDRLTYDADWMASPAGRPLSLPFSLGAGQSNDSHRILRGDAVAAYFENLIPDNERILQRLRDRYAVRSTAPFDPLRRSDATASAPSNCCRRARLRATFIALKRSR